MTWRIWPMLPARSIPRYLEHMEANHGLRFTGLGWVPFLAKYQRIHPLHARAYDIDYFPEKDPAEIQEYFDMCEASGWEPVLQLQHYKILREEPEGGVPLYWDEDERNATWKKATRKALWAALVVVALLALVFGLVWLAFAKLNGDGWTSLLYYQPKYIQGLALLGGFLLFYALFETIKDLTGAMFSWDRLSSPILYGLGTFLQIFTCSLILGIVWCATMACLVEYKSLGSFIGVMIGNGIGHLWRNYFDEDAADRRNLKGIFGPPKIVAILASVTLVLYGVGLLGFSFYQNQTVNNSIDHPDEPTWVVSENLMCDTLVYDAMHHSYNSCVYELRDSAWIRRDPEHHRTRIVESMIEKDIFHYMTPEQLNAGIAEGGNDLNARRAHAVCAEKLLDDGVFDEVLISQTGHRYIVCDEERVYRLHCSVSFYDDPYLGMEETDVPEIEVKGLEIYEELVSQKEELEKMFFN